MITNVLTRLFAVFVAVVAFFTNTFGGLLPARGRHDRPVPEQAITLQYGDKKCEKLILFLPDDKTEPVDILLMIHGGAWMGGDEKEFAENCLAACEECGFAAASMDYSKLTNGANAYDMTDEIDMAIRKIIDEMALNGYTADKLIIAGHSAGAHISLMYAYTRHDSSPVEIAFVMSNCAPSEFIKDSRTKTTTMGKFGHLLLTALSGQAITRFNEKEQEEYIRSVSPVYLVNSSVPPTIVVHGNADTMVPYQNSVDLFSALQSAGVESRMLTYEGANHFLGREFEAENNERTNLFFEFYNKFA